MHNDVAWRQHDFERGVGGGFAINFVPIEVLADDTFDELCDPGCSRCVLMVINMSILLVIVKYERCFAYKISVDL